MLPKILVILATIALLALVVIDGLQTLTIANQPHRWRERNPVLRRLMNLYPPGGRRDGIVIGYFAAAAAVMLALATFAGMRHWSLFLAVVGWCCIAELYCVLMNHRLGIAASNLTSN